MIENPNKNLNQKDKHIEIIANQGRSILSLNFPNKLLKKRNKYEFTKEDLLSVKYEIDDIKERLKLKNDLKAKDKKILLLEEKLRSKSIFYSKSIPYSSKDKFYDNKKSQNNTNYNKTCSNFLDLNSNIQYNNNYPKDINSLEIIKPLLFDIKNLIEEFTDTNKIRDIQIKSKIHKTLGDLLNTIDKEKEYNSLIKEKERILSIMKREIQDLKTKEEELIKENNKLKLNLIKIEKELNNIKKLNNDAYSCSVNNNINNVNYQNNETTSNINALNKLINNPITRKFNNYINTNLYTTNLNSLNVNDFKNTTLAKENSDLKMRLEKSCLFISKKKETIIKLTQRLEESQRKINELQNEKHFCKGEENKIKELLSRKLKNTNICYNLEYSNNNTDFKINCLKEKYKDLLKEIIENGTQEFIKHYFLVNVNEQEELLSFISDQMLSYIDYCNRLNKLCMLFTCCLILNEDDLIKQIRLLAFDILNCERVTLWIYNSKNNEYKTIINETIITENSNYTYFENIFNKNVYKRSSIVDTNNLDTLITNNNINKNEHIESNIQDNINNNICVNNKEHNSIYPENLETVLNQKTTTNSIIALSITNFKGDRLGIIEAANSNNGIFSHDEEYLLYLMSKYFSYKLENINIKDNSKNNAYKLFEVNKSLVNIINASNYYDLQILVEKEIKNLFNCLSCKILFIDNNSFYSFTSIKEKKSFFFEGLAAVSLDYLSGLFCLVPSKDEDYNPIIDLQINSSLESLYSIPLKNNNKSYAVLQYSIIEESYEYKIDKIRHPCRLDSYKEQFIEVLSDIIHNTICKIK